MQLTCKVGMSRECSYFIASSGLLVFLFVLTSTDAAYVYLLPEDKLLYGDQTPNIRLCIKDKELDLCGVHEKLRFKNAFCTYWVALNGNNSSTNTPRNFTNSLSISSLHPGVYQFLCRLDESTAWTSTQRIIMSTSVTYLDCPPLPKTFELRLTFREDGRRVCCLRSQVASSWLQAITGKVNLCHKLDCSVEDAPGLLFVGASLHFEPNRLTPMDRYTVQCTAGSEVFKDYFFIVDSYTNAPILNIRPDSSVLLRPLHHTAIDVCLSWQQSDKCLTDASTVDCNMTGNSLTDHDTEVIHFENSIALAQIEEGTYHVSCHSREFRVSAEVVRHVLHQENYIWSCNIRSHLAYLAHGSAQVQLCQWKANVSSRWNKRLVEYGLEEMPFTCYSLPGDMRFQNGRFNVDRQFQKPGIFSIFCRDELVVENMVIADAPGDIAIVIVPQASVINKASPGRMFAQLQWRNAPQDMLHRLRAVHTVNCSITYPEEHGSKPGILFTDMINYESIPEGVVEIKCACSAFGLVKKVAKLIQLRPVSVRSVVKNATVPAAVRNVSHDRGVEQRLALSGSRDKKELLKQIGYFRRGRTCVEPEGRLTAGNGILAIQFMPVPNDTVVCSDFVSDTTIYVPQSDIYVVAVPHQTFYHFHQKEAVCLQVTSRNSTTQVKKLLAKVQLDCAVHDSNNQLVHQTSGCLDKANRHILEQFDPKLTTDNYTFACSNLSTEVFGSVTMPIVDGSKLSLRINGLNKMYHFTGDEHMYVCLLGGLKTGELLRERYRVKWKSLLSTQLADVQQNFLRVTNDTRPGPYKYQCLYQKNALNLIVTVSFYVTNETGLSVQLRYGWANMSQTVRTVLPVVICETSYMGGLLNIQPRWCRLHGTIPFTTKDRSDVVCGRSDLYIGNSTTGSATFACTVEHKGKQASKLFIVTLFHSGESAKIKPMKRLYMAGSKVTCKVDNLHDDLYRATLSLYTDHYGVVQPDHQSVVWSSDRPLLEREGVAKMFCRTSVSYLGTEYTKTTLMMPVQIDFPHKVSLSPQKAVYSINDTVFCQVDVKHMENVIVLLSVCYRPPSAPPTCIVSKRISFPDELSAGIFNYSCILILPYRVPTVLEGTIRVAAIDMYSTFRPIRHNDALVAWECQLNRGYVEEAMRYEVNYSSTPGGFFTIEGNRVNIESYSEFATVTLRCRAFLDGNTSAEVVEQHVYAEPPFDLGNYLTYNENVSIFTLAVMLTTSTIIYLATGIYLFKCSHIRRSVDDYLSQASSPDILPKTTSLCADDNPAIVQIDRDQLGRHYFAYLVKVVSKYDHLQRIFVRLEPKQRQALWDSNSSESSPEYAYERHPSGPTDMSVAELNDTETGGPSERNSDAELEKDNSDSESKPCPSLPVNEEEDSEATWLQPVVIQPPAECLPGQQTVAVEQTEQQG